MKRVFANSSASMNLVFGAIIFSLLFFGIWSGRFSFFQEVFSAPIRGSGTINQVAAFGTTDTIGDSIIFDNGTNVGIGTSNPASRLHVFGGDFSLEQNLGNSNKMFFTDDHVAHYIAANGYWIDVVGNANEVFRVFNGAAELMRVAPSGNVGIGISNPANKLHVNGGWLRVEGTGVGSDAATRIGVHDTDNTGGVSGWWLSQNNNGDFAIHQNAVGDRLSIDGGGNVGIGATNPGQKLEVNGNIKINGADNGLVFGSGSAALGVAAGNGSWTRDSQTGDVILRAANGKKIILGRGQDSPDHPAALIVGSDGNLGMSGGNTLYLGREESFGGSDTGGSDYGYIRWDNDNNTYNFWGNSGENGALVIGTENDGQNQYSDVVVLKSNAAVVADAPELITTGAVLASGVLESRRAADGCNAGILNLWDTTNDRGWHITNRRGCEGSLNDLKFWFWDGANWHNRVTFGNGGVVETNPDNVAGGGIKVADDGGFYDYNNGWIDFRGSNGVRILNESGGWDNNRSIRAGALCIRDDCKTAWSQVAGGITSETDPVWTGWRDKPGVTGAADGRSALGGELRTDTLSACRGGSCSHLRWSGDNSNYLRGRTFVDADQMEINSGWPDGQRMIINSNQLWKNESGDQTLYLQWSNEDGGVQIGDNADGPGNNLRVYGDINNAGYIVQSNRYYDDDPNFFIDANTASQVSTIYANNWFRAQGNTGFYFENWGGGWFMQDATWIRAYNDKNIYTPGEIQAGTIRANGNLCIGNDCRNGWPGGGIGSESDTLQSVTNRGNSTSQVVGVGGTFSDIVATRLYVHDGNIHVRGNEDLTQLGGTQYGRLRVGNAWGYAGLYADTSTDNQGNDLVFGASSGLVRIGPNGGRQNLKVTGKVGFDSCNSIDCGLWLWDYSDSNHVIYSANPAGAPGGLAGAWDTGHRFRFRTATGQGFLWENNANQLLADLDADDGRFWLRGHIDVPDVWIRNMNGGAGGWATSLSGSGATANLQQVTVAGNSTDRGLTVTAGEIRQQGGSWLRYFSNADWQGIHVDNSNTSANTVGIMQNNDGSFRIHRWNQGDILYTNSAGSVTAFMQGNVGIGTTNPLGYKLSVVGRVGGGTAIHGESPDQSGSGVQGRGNPGISGIGLGASSVGIYGSGLTGVKGKSTTGFGHGVEGSSESRAGVAGFSRNVEGVFGQGRTGVQGLGDVYDFYAGGLGANYAPFTGAHEVKLNADFPKNPKGGLIVSFTGKTEERKENGETSLSSTLPTVKISNTKNDKTVFGALVFETPLPPDHWYKTKEGERFGAVNALGEGRVWVSDINGEPEVGDYITTSEIPGYGMKQDDDLLHNYTLGKVTEKVEWNNITETVEFNGKEYKVHLIAVVYVSG